MQVRGLSVLLVCLALTGGRQGAPSRPEENRFSPVVLVPGGELDEPMAFEVLPDERN